MVQKSQNQPPGMVLKTLWQKWDKHLHINWCKNTWTINRIPPNWKEETKITVPKLHCVKTIVVGVGPSKLLIQRCQKVSSGPAGNFFMCFFSWLRSEVPGSPIFMMQLCSGARHIEVQIVGDQLLGVFFMMEGWKTNLKDRYWLEIFQVDGINMNSSRRNWQYDAGLVNISEVKRMFLKVFRDVEW